MYNIYVPPPELSFCVSLSVLWQGALGPSGLWDIRICYRATSKLEEQLLL